MNNSPAFQFYPKEFLADLDVEEMTMRERGIYITLLCHCWLQNGLKGGSRLVDKWFKQAPTVAGLFYEKDGVFRHKRLDREMEKQDRWREKSKEGGLHSAEIKRLSKAGSRVVQPKANTPVSCLLSPVSSLHIKDIKDIVSYLNDKAGKNFSDKSENTIHLISGRLSEGRTVDDFKKVIDVKVEKWKGDPKMDDFLRPDTLFRPKNFEAYLNEKPKIEPYGIRFRDDEKELT